MADILRTLIYMNKSCKNKNGVGIPWYAKSGDRDIILIFCCIVTAMEPLFHVVKRRFKCHVVEL